MKLVFAFTFLTMVAISCEQRPTKRDLSKLNFILLGYDSLAYYTGDSIQTSSLLRGSINDSNFISQVISSAKKISEIDSQYIVKIKPITASNVVANTKTLVGILNDNVIEHRVIDSLTSDEQKYFGSMSLTKFIETTQPMKLMLPKDEETSNVDKTNAITLILWKNDIIYAYQQKDYAKIKQLNYSTVRNYINDMKKRFNNNKFNIVIEPSTYASYKNTIDILDEMSINLIKKYSLIDLTKEDSLIIQSL